MSFTQLVPKYHNVWQGSTILSPIFVCTTSVYLNVQATSLTKGGRMSLDVQHCRSNNG